MAVMWYVDEESRPRRQPGHVLGYEHLFVHTIKDLMDFSPGHETTLFHKSHVRRVFRIAVHLAGATPDLGPALRPRGAAGVELAKD